jgi:hypothetical protein
MLMILNAAIGEDVPNLDTLIDQCACDKDGPVTFKRLFLSAHEREPERACTFFHAIYALLK